MKPKTKMLVLGGVAVAAVLLAQRRRKGQAETVAAQQQPLAVRAAQSVLLVTAPLPKVERGADVPEPPGGWEAWLTPSALLANLEACKAAGSATAPAQAACALDNVFINAKWPPSSNSAPWQEEAYATALAGAKALEGAPGFH